MESSTLDRAPEPFDRTLLPHPTSVAAARRLVRELLDRAGREDLLDDAVLLVSEVVTNALIHAGSPIRVRGRVVEHGVRVEVGDASPHHPALRNYADTAGTGRGLTLMVDLSDDWGIVPGVTGKTVWFELGGGPRPVGHDPSYRPGEQPAPALPPVPLRPEAGPSVVSVQLLNMPLMLHEAWREHAETLLREYLLASLDPSGESAEGDVAAGGPGATADPIQVHADATDAMALLEEQVPAAEVDVDPGRVMTEAVEPRVTAAEVWVQVPRASVPHFATLERALDHAFVLVHAGQVLAPLTQPEIQSFRRWVCHQVRDQAAGKRPVPWLMSVDVEAPQRRPALDAVVEDVRHSAEALVAADDTNQIVAVSGTAAALLGYDAAEDLVGDRLVSIIPPRFRQAHIAGFTMHLLVGRSPLLGREISVPALRRDGTEVTVRLEVTSRTGQDGTTCFVARMRPSDDRS